VKRFLSKLSNAYLELLQSTIIFYKIIEKLCEFSLDVRCV